LSILNRISDHTSKVSELTRTPTYDLEISRSRPWWRFDWNSALRIFCNFCENKQDIYHSGDIGDGWSRGRLRDCLSDMSMHYLRNYICNYKLSETITYTQESTRTLLNRFNRHTVTVQDPTKSAVARTSTHIVHTHIPIKQVKLQSVSCYTCA